ncbi:MAG: hypothetical protein HOO67_03790, partial [Candidatus Peribacteraceae bacterium]|nr:hypothetical protein [Candidatus Peribacteraceae bacterium]
TFKNSSFRLLDSSFANCTALETVDGVLTCGSDGGGTSFLAGQGINLNGANAFSTNSILTGSLIRFTNLSGSTIFAKNTLASSGSLKVLGTASGGQLHASNQLRSSGTLSVQGISNLKGAAIFGSTLSLNGVTYTFPGGDGSASGKVLKTNGAGQLAWSSDIDTDTDTNTVTAVGRGLGLTSGVLTLNATITGSLVRFTNLSGSTVFAKNTLASSGSLKVLGTASGGQLHASNQLRSSGTLSVQGVSNLKGAAIFGSTLSLNGVTYTFPGGDGSASGKVLKTNSAGQLSWSSDIDTDTNTTYTAGQGLTLNGSNAFSINSTQTGSLLSFTTVSGSRLFAKNILTTSGTLTVKKAAGTATGNILIVDTKGLVYDATTKDVGIGTASPGAKLHVVSKAVNTALLKITASDNSDLFNIDEDVSGNGLVTVRNAAGASVVEMYGLTDGLFSVYKSGVISPKVQFYAGGDSYVNAGNFGVGTITPGSRLSVSGSVIISPLGTLDTIAADAGLAMEIIGAASGRILHAQDQLRSSGSLSIQGAAAFKSSSFTLLDSGFANCTALETSNGVLTCGSDAGGTYAAGQGLTLNGSNAFSTNSILTGSLIRFTNLSGSTIFAKNTLASSGSLKVLGTASGGQLHASNQLRSSGTLTVQGATILRNDLTLGGGNLNFTEGTTIGDGGDALIINSSGTFTVQDILDISDNNMVNVGDIALDSLSSDAGASISVALGSDPGDDFIVDTTGLVYEGDTNRVGIGTAAPKTTLEIIGTASGIQIHARDKLLSSGSLVVAGAARFKSSSFTLLDSGFANCTALETADGVLTCGSDGGTTYVAGQGLTLNGSNAFSTNSILTGSLIRFTNLSGSTIFAKNTLASSGSLKVLGTASGGQLHASNQLRSSGTLSIQGITNLKGAAIFGSTLSLNGVTYTFPGGDGSASGKVLKTNGAGQLAWSTDLNTGGGSSFGTGNTLTIGDSRYVRKSGDTMTGALIINPSSDAIQLNVKASALQLLDTMVIESNFGTDWLVVQANGDVQTTQALLVNGTLSTSNTAILVAKPLAIGGVSALAYNAISDSGTTSHGTINFEDIGADNDLYIEGALEVDGSVYFDGGFEVFGTGSGSIFHASTQLRSSGGLIVQTTGLFKGNLTTRGVLSGSSLVVSGGTKTYSGIVIQRSSGAKFLTLRDADNSKAVGIYSGSGSPWNKILAATGSFYLDNNRGNAYLNVAGGDKKAWRIVQLGTGSGSTYPDRADLWHQNSTVTAGNASSCTQDVNEMYDIFCGPGTPAQNDAFTNGFFLRAGTYTFSTMGLTSNNKGSIDWYIDGTSVVSAQDWYSVTGTYNVVKTATVTVTGNGYHVLRGIVSTKNASSSNYAMLLTKMWFVPTSDNTHTSPGADYAEWFRATPDATGSLPQKGDLVCVDVTAPNTVRKCENEADSNVMGIVSTSPSFIGNDHTFDGVPIPGTVLVGLIGQIPAKVIVESGSGGGLGAIRPGDSLTPASRPGYARKAMAGEATVGVALEGLESGEGLIQVLVARRNGSLTADAVSDRVLQTIKDLKIEDELKLALKQTVEQFSASGTLLQPISDEVERQLQQQISTLGMGSVTDRLAALEARMATMSGGIVPSAETEPVPSRAEGSSALTSENLSLSGSLTAQELRAQTLSLEENLAAKEGRFAGDLYVDGVFHVRDLYVPNGVRIDGGLHAAALEVQSGAVINGTLTLNSDLNVTKSINFASGSVLSAHDLIVRGALHVVGPVTIDGLAQFLGDVEIKGQLTLSNRQAGFAEIPQTGTSVTIVFEPPLNGTPVVTASPDVPLLYAVSRATATGFVIRLSAPAAERVGFSWTALTAVDPQTALGHAAADGPEPLPFLVDGDGIPLSEDEAWNSCIRNHPLLTADGSPISCGGYHDAYVWEHPDLHINFTWNTSMTPPLLQLPEGFVVERAEAPAVSDESSSSSSDSSSSAPQSPEAEAESSSSSEDASSSSSAASDDSSSSSSSSDSSDTSSSAASESSESSDSDEASSASSSDSGETSSASSSDDSETSSASSEADGSSSSSDENFTPLTPPPGEDQ